MPAHRSRPATRLDAFQIEQTLRAAVPEAMFASPRAVRRIIRADLNLPILGSRVPHRDCVALRPRRLLELTDDVWALPTVLPDTILLVARPDAETAARHGPNALPREYCRLLYHGCLDIAARRALAASSIDDAGYRDLVDRVGEVPFAEAAAVFADEGLLRRQADSREVMAEFIAVVLEMAAFSPRLLAAWFPAVEDHDRLVALFDGLVDGAAIRARVQPARFPEPEGTEHPPPIAASVAVDHVWRPSGRHASNTADFLRHRSLDAARRGNDVRGMLLQWRRRALARGDGMGRAPAARGLECCINRLVRRLERCVGLAGFSRRAMASVVAEIVDRAGGSAWSQPARLLYDLQKMCVDLERACYRTQLLPWALTFGRVRLIKPLPAQRVTLVHRHAATALHRLTLLGLPGATGEAALHFVSSAVRTTETAVRSQLVRPVRQSLVVAGLEPRTLVEEAAFDKLVAELLDGICEFGFVSFGNLRDAVSRSKLKLSDLASAGEFISGGPLLQADRRLAMSLDGAYRRAPVYLHAMQRLSAVAFGVPLGRAITLHVLLCFGGAWILWQGLEHLVELVSSYSFGVAVHVSSGWAVPATGVAIWGLMHLARVRRAVLRGLRAVGRGLEVVFVHLPRRLLRLPLVELLLTSRPARFFRRYAWSPLVFTGGVWLLAPHGGGWLSRSNPWLPAFLFASSAVVLNSAFGRAVQERVLEGVGRAIRQIHTRVIVGLLAGIMDTFRRAISLVEGMLYTVDEQLRFRTDESTLVLAVKSVLTTLWSAVEWCVRFCVTLLLEPQLNPIKHFPVVTVSHKLVVPTIPLVAANLAAATGMERGLALTTVTFVSTAIPGVFGFLAWELKENWRLYAANRPRTLQPVQVRSHSESMRQLLIPGFHSGRIPKLFGRLRRQLRNETGRRGRPEEQLAALRHDIAVFVDDECLRLLRRSRPLADVTIRVCGVRLATNRVAVEIVAEQLGPEPLRLEFRAERGAIVSRVFSTGWLDRLPDNQQRLVRLALAGLDCLCGADFTTVIEGGRPESRPVAPLSWVDWRDAWERERA